MKYTREQVISALRCKDESSSIDLSGLDLSYCNLTGLDLSGANLSWANLSNAKLSKAKLRYCNLTGAKLSKAKLSNKADLTGADLSRADLSGASLRYCNLTGAHLRGADLSWADLRHCHLSYCDLRDCDLTNADLKDCDLYSADLSGSNLKDTQIDDLPIPAVPDIHRAVLDAVTAPGHTLDMSDWHRCETTHCRAGWVVHLAGEAGYALEEEVGAAMAGTLIYAASDPNLEQIPDFHTDDETAMADIKALAAK